MHNGQGGAASRAELAVFRSGGLRGEAGAGADLSLPGDKSLSHRAALFSALAEGSSTVGNFLVSGVTHAMLDALTRLGVNWQLEGKTLSVEGTGIQSETGAASVLLDCGNSATTLRLLAGAAAAWGRPVVLDGSPGLRRRPMNRIIDPLRLMGVPVAGEGGCAPLQIGAAPRPLRALAYRLPVASAQVKTCLLLAGLAAGGATWLSEPGPSRDHTERMLRAMGVSVESGAAEGGYWTRLTPPEPLALKPLRIDLPCDSSAAAFLIVAGLIVPGSQIRLRGVGMNPTRTGLLDTLIEMGAEIEIRDRGEQGGEPAADLLVRHSPLRGVRVQGERVVRMIDEFPVFALAAACAEGQTVVAEAEELRHKESDRISALGGELQRLGVAFAETPDGFRIDGGRPIDGGGVEAHGDHRLAMSLALAGLVSRQPVRVRGAEIIRESFPEFVQVLTGLGADMRLEAGF